MKTPTEELYRRIMADTIADTGILITSKAIIESLEKGADPFNRVSDTINAKCFDAVIKYQNTKIFRTILKYYADNKKTIDFSKRVFDEDGIHTYGANWLQYIFKYGTTEMFKKSCDFIGNHEKVKKILNTPIDNIFTTPDGRDLPHSSSIWEDALLGMNLQRLIFDPINTLNNEKYSKDTIQYLTLFFTKWRTFSGLHSKIPEPNLVEDWKKYAETYNTSLRLSTNSQKNLSQLPLPLENPELKDPLEFVIDPYLQFKIAIAENLIDMNYIGENSNFTFKELVERLSLVDSSKINNKELWDNVIHPLMRICSKFGEIKLSGEVEETPQGLKTTSLDFLGNPGTKKLKRISAKVTLDFKPLNRALDNAIKKSNEDEIGARMRRHSDAIRGAQAGISKLSEQVSGIVEVQINDYMMDPENTPLAKSIFSKLSKSLIVHTTIRELDASNLFTANTSTSAAKYAKLAGNALEAVAVLVPVQGAAIIPAIYNIGTKYITGNFAKKQSEGVSSTSIKINLPILLVELSESMTEMLLEVAAKRTDLNANQIENLTQKLTVKIAEEVNKRIDNLHNDIKRNGAPPTKEELRQVLFIEAVKVINKLAFEDKPSPHVIVHSLPPRNSGNSTGSSTASEKPSPGGNPSSQKKNRGGGKCSVS